MEERGSERPELVTGHLEGPLVTATGTDLESHFFSALGAAGHVARVIGGAVDALVGVRADEVDLKERPHGRVGGAGALYDVQRPV